MKGQLVGPLEFRGMNLTESEFEFLLGRTGAIQTSIKEDPKPKVKKQHALLFLNPSIVLKYNPSLRFRILLRFSSWIHVSA
jgi:hypothetical protein